MCVCWQAEGEDNLKKMQLMELAILNGTYRDANIKSRKGIFEKSVQLVRVASIACLSFIVSILDKQYFIVQLCSMCREGCFH